MIFQHSSVSGASAQLSIGAAEVAAGPGASRRVQDPAFVAMATPGEPAERRNPEGAGAAGGLETARESTRCRFHGPPGSRLPALGSHGPGRR